MKTQASSGVKHYYRQEKLVVIMGKTRVASLIMEDAHRVDHRSTEIIVEESRYSGHQDGQRDRGCSAEVGADLQQEGNGRKHPDS